MIHSHIQRLLQRPCSLITIFVMLLPTVICASEPVADFSAPHLQGYYVINLASSLDPFSEHNVAYQDIFSRYLLYTSTFQKDGKTWSRLRLGFFPSKEVAQNVQQTFAGNFKQSWIAKASEQEKVFSLENALFGDRINTTISQTGNTPIPVIDQPTDNAIAPISIAKTDKILPSTGSITTTEDTSTESLLALSEERIAELMEQGRQAMASADYSRAVQIYTRILEATEHKYLQDAQEYLGLARERKGQIAHAKAEYERYLELYPQGEGADRVRQRLVALITAYEAPTQTVLRDTKEQREQNQWETYGGISQYYRRDVSYINATDVNVNQSLLSTDMDYSARLRKSNYEIRSRFTGGYDWDFLDTSENEFRITSLYIDGVHNPSNLSGRFGRQSQSSGGVLGRFDGLLAGYGITPTIKMNMVAGLPVETGHLNEINTDKQFYGISFDFGTFNESWDFNTFYITQEVNGITDRQAIGGEARYFKTNHSYFGLVDYDISYQVVNAIFLLGNWTLSSSTNLSVILDHRKSPILTTSNALQGQTVPSIDELLNTYTEEEIRQLAEDRTPDSDSYSFSITHPLSDRFQIGGDITVTTLSSTPASGGVEAIEATGNDYFMSMQLMASDLFRDNDLNILSLRYADTSTANTTTLNLNTRFPVNDQWRINPLFRIDLREFETHNSTQWTFSPALRVFYRWQRETSLEFELSTEWSSHELANETETLSGYYLSLGYRHEF